MSRPFIILIDDDEDKRFLLEIFFRRNFPDNKVCAVADCTSALTLLESPLPKVVVTNGRIAQADGIEFASYAIKETKSPVVMVSLREQLKQKALDAGVSAFVETGNDKELREAITQALANLQES